MPEQEWELVGEPISDNGDTEEGMNRSGMVIYLVGSLGRKEVGSVGRVRQNTLNPHVTYDRMVDRVVADAVKTLETIKKLTALSGQLQ